MKAITIRELAGAVGAVRTGFDEHSAAGGLGIATSPSAPRDDRQGESGRGEGDDILGKDKESLRDSFSMLGPPEADDKGVDGCSMLGPPEADGKKGDSAEGEKEKGNREPNCGAGGDAVAGSACGGDLFSGPRIKSGVTAGGRDDIGGRGDGVGGGGDKDSGLKEDGHSGSSGLRLPRRCAPRNDNGGWGAVGADSVRDKESLRDADSCWIPDQVRDDNLRDREIIGVSTDTRTLGAGECFFAIRGENFDGHAYVSAAVEKGAACVVVEDGACVSGCGVPCVVVEDTVRALGDLARWYREQLGAKVVAITGSAGKTTVRHILGHVLSQHFRCHQAKKSFNNHIGLPLTLLGADEDDEIIVCELGTNSPGEIEYLSRVAGPDAAVVNNVGEAHLEGFGTVENIAQEKTSIRAGLRDGGKLLINVDCAVLVSYCDEAGLSYVGFGTGASADVRASEVKTTGLAGELVVDDMVISVPLAGEANLYNALAAYAVARQFGVTADEFAKAMPGLESPEMRLDLQYAGRVTIINDCYNANPASMRNAVETLGHLVRGHDGRAVFICGHMAELGADADRLHAELGGTIGAAELDLLVGVGAHADVTVEAAARASENGLKTRIFPDVEVLCNNLQQIVRPDDIILVKGSRAAGLERAIDELVGLFG
ncbi:UDP-N-acetylmuramoyl-tripeptide--D-alanyl-D-alanine ligase [Anaerohalosphaera lusitana]|uniref:UDP-N-acetylmuramoyl-tripeptide--D-alanyl-D-alanine ligase n=1 Tax=Anaerohalosphaera lusitana TaxID=1936003 RepID=A0A1U9NID2_9BACT|nr:UDP-N-acetylmuramoyl-tripeptide--D-alanyl-D-alanine ligase [Anaerohalosphaera lusitana]AQT67689.1 UDP-N-acetylmuramoyl-tripeptide--D-alanyl-D-alanine ligase [Anaerohalosphaera lusitana]